MAFRGGMRRAANEAGLWLAVAGAAVGSFYFFEDAYQAFQQNWPRMQVSFAPDARQAAAAAETTQAVSGGALAGRPDTGAEAHDLRPTDTGLTEFLEKISKPERKVLLNANHYGHFVVEAEINGVKVDLLTDTGATYVALNYETALRLGFSAKTLQFTSRSSTANGIASVAPVDLGYLRIGGIAMHDVKAVIAEPGKMTQNLLGMSFISRLSGFQLSGGRLLMVQN
jgi:clan AA aspartic protease (TIGR02281 family)